MARADWGGGSDYSGIFANLNEIFESRVEAATARAKRQAEEEQAAADADTYDKWKNGLITDDEWLAYIRTRQEESKGDPTEYAEWTKTLREHETGIHDAQTESAFEQGEISIHAIIGYYKTRLEGLEKNSPEYRELASRLSDLTENRDSEEIYDQAEAIIDRIERGQSTYQELLSFYQNKIGTLNPNSDLYRQVKREIGSIRDIVDAVGARSGGGGGGGGGSRRSGGGRSGGGSGFGNDGKGGVSADMMAEINDLIVTYRRGGSLYDPTAPDPVMRYQQYNVVETVDDLNDALENDRDTIQALVEYERDNPGAQFLVDQWGNQYPNTPAFKHQLDDMMVRTFEQKWALKFLDGDPDANKELLRLGTYINEHMQRHNTDNIRPAWEKQTKTAMAAVQSAAMSGDPDRQMAAYRTASRLVNTFVDDYTKKTTFSRANEITEEDDTPIARVKKTKTALPREVLPDTDLQEEMQWFSGFFSAAAGRGLEDPDSILQALSDLVDQRPENIAWTKDDLEKIVAGDPSDNTKMGIIETYDAAVGLRTGTWQYYAEGPIVRPRPVQDIEAAKQEAESDGSRLVATFDRGKIVWRPIEPPDRQETVWVYGGDDEKSGQPVPAGVIDAMGLEELNRNMLSGKFERVQSSAVQPWGKVTMSDGKVWYVDPVTNLFYKRMPVQYKYDKTGNLIYNDATGSPEYKYEPFAHVKGVAAPFAGMTSKQAQQLLEQAQMSGIIDPSQFFTRDENGDAQFDNPILEGMYWSQADEIAKEAYSKQARMKAFSERSARNVRRERRIGEQPTVRTTARNRPKAEVEDLAWEKRMLMAHRAETENFREQARLSALAPEQENPAQSVEQFASSIGINIGGRDKLNNRQTESLDRFRQQEGATPMARPTAKLPPVKMAPVSKPAAELPALALPMANSVEMIDKRNPPPLPKPPTAAPKPAARKAPPKKIATTRKPVIR